MTGAEIDRPVYPIGVVQKLTGLTGRRIRYYEQLGLVTPARSAGRQRLYSPDDVRILLEIKEALAAGQSLASLRERGRRPAPEDRRARFVELDDLEAVRNYFEESRGPTSLYPIQQRAQLIRTIDQLRLKRS